LTFTRNHQIISISKKERIKGSKGKNKKEEEALWWWLWGGSCQLLFTFYFLYPSNYLPLYDFTLVPCGISKI
jgi:hypothetical protein